MSRLPLATVISLASVLLACDPPALLEDPTLSLPKKDSQYTSASVIAAKMTGFTPTQDNPIEAGSIIGVKNNAVVYTVCSRLAALGSSFKDSQGRVVSTAPEETEYVLTIDSEATSNIKSAFMLRGAEINADSYTSIKLYWFSITNGKQRNVTGDVIEGGYRQASDECKRSIKSAISNGYEPLFAVTAVIGDLEYIVIQKEKMAVIAGEVEVMKKALGAKSSSEVDGRFFFQAGRPIWGARTIPLPPQ